MSEDSEYIMDLLLCDREAILDALDGTFYTEADHHEFFMNMRLDLSRVNAEIARRVYLKNKNKALPSVTRVEVIDHSPGFQLGRAWVKWHLNAVELSFQDNGRTLKVFVK